MVNSMGIPVSTTSAISLLSLSSSPLSSCSFRVLSSFRIIRPMTKYKWNEGNDGIQFRRVRSPYQVKKASANFSDPAENMPASNGTERKDDDAAIINIPVILNKRPMTQQEGIILCSSREPILSLTQDVAMGLVLRAAGGTGWTTDSGLEGPGEIGDMGEEEQLKFPDLSKSPRRKMRVAFTCNVCGDRTIRAINPLAYTDGTVFVQCKGCDVFHKLVDNLNLFHEMRGKIYRGHDIPWYANGQPYDFFDGQYPLL